MTADERGMKDDTKTTSSPVLPVIASLACLASLGLIGMAGPEFKQIYADFNIDPVPPHFRVVQLTHWGWTLPLGLAISSALIVGSRRWKLKTSLVVNFSVIVAAVAVFIGFGFMAYLPIF
jgi:hypothetical protein